MIKIESIVPLPTLLLISRNDKHIQISVAD